jgi:UDP-N-acetylglucosamine acyltransferase
MPNSPHAIIDPAAEISADVEVGPLCVIGPQVKIDAGCRLLNNVTVLGRITIGKDNVFFPNSVIGAAPQDIKFKGEPTEVIIGNSNVFREAVTIHAGTAKGGGATRIGDHGLFMVNAHVGHDSIVGNHVVICNNAFILGNVICHNHVSIMAGAGIFHFITLSECCYISAFSKIHYDVPPFLKLDGSDAISGLNRIGIRRAQHTESDIEALESAYQMLYTRNRPLELAIADVERQGLNLNPCVKQLLDFLRRQSRLPPR